MEENRLVLRIRKIRRRSLRTRPKTAIFVVAVVIAADILLGIYIISAITTPRYERQLWYGYYAKIEPNSSAKFMVYLPMPINNQNETHPDFFNSLVVKGNATVNQVSTDIGKALEIIGSRNVTIKWNLSGTYLWTDFSDFSHDYSSISLLEGDAGIGFSVRAYSDSSDIHLALESEYGNLYGNVGGESGGFQVDGYLSPGWNNLSARTYGGVF